MGKLIKKGRLLVFVIIEVMLAANFAVSIVLKKGSPQGIVY